MQSTCTCIDTENIEVSQCKGYMSAPCIMPYDMSSEAASKNVQERCVKTQISNQVCDSERFYD